MVLIAISSIIHMAGIPATVLFVVIPLCLGECTEDPAGANALRMHRRSGEHRCSAKSPPKIACGSSE